MYVAILISSNFSKFRIRSLKKKKAPKHTQSNAHNTRSPNGGGSRTALIRQLKASASLLASTVEFVPPIPVSPWARPSGTSPALCWLLQFSPRTGSHTYTPPGTVPWQPSTLHNTLFLWQFLCLLQDHETSVVSFVNVLFKL